MKYKIWFVDRCHTPVCINEYIHWSKKLQKIRLLVQGFSWQPFTLVHYCNISNLATFQEWISSLHLQQCNSMCKHCTQVHMLHWLDHKLWQHCTEWHIDDTALFSPTSDIIGQVDYCINIAEYKNCARISY